MRYLLFVFLFTGFAFASCSTDASSQTPTPVLLSAVAIDSVGVSMHTVTIRVVCTIPTPCWIFVRTEYSKQSNVFSVSVYGRRVSNNPCVQVLSSLKATLTAAVDSAGSYTFRFWRSDTSSVDTTVTVP